jgi:hypothetical protein
MFGRIQQIVAGVRAVRQIPKALAPGDICSIRSSQGGFRIVKVLATDSGIIHIRLFKESFDQRPSKLSTDTLSLGSIHEPGGFGIGHLPLPRAEFGSWLPMRIGSEPVSEAELAGYRIWQEAGGGVWG